MKPDDKYYSHWQNILRIFQVYSESPFAFSELDYNHQQLNTIVVPRAKQRKTCIVENNNILIKLLKLSQECLELTL